MNPSSQDLRDCLIHPLEASQDTPPAVVERCGVRPSYVATLWQRSVQHGTGRTVPPVVALCAGFHPQRAVLVAEHNGFVTRQGATSCGVARRHQTGA